MSLHKHNKNNAHVLMYMQLNDKTSKAKVFTHVT